MLIGLRQPFHPEPLFQKVSWQELPYYRCPAFSGMILVQNHDRDRARFMVRHAQQFE